MRRERFIYGALFLITAAVFWPVVQYDFVSFDDPACVTDNPQVREGFSPANVGWAFTAIVAGHWHPLTCLSHMLDCQLFGLRAGWHHLTSLLLHAVNTLLLFHVLRRMTRELWPSALVAALFALHPLHVQSVAWIAERKDLLSAFFALLTLLAYSRYAQESEPKRKIRNYLLALLFFAFGLMSKEMLVTWPFVLLLLDFWPLNRVSGFGFRVSGATDSGSPVSAAGVGATPAERVKGGHLSTLPRLLFEKLPFFALTIAGCVIAFFAQRHEQLVIPSSLITISQRFENALVSYVRYMGKTFWPDPLVIFYPYVNAWPTWQVAGSAVFLTLVTIVALRQARQRPFLLVGWLWFLGMLVPVIGLVQICYQSIADHYLYLPLIGLFMMIVWGARDFARERHCSKWGLRAAATAAIAGCCLATTLQLRYWRNSETLWSHALVVPGNFVAHLSLALPLVDRGELDEGIAHLNEALRINPASAVGHRKLAEALERQGKFSESIEHYNAVLLCNPDPQDLADALNNLAWMLATNPDPEIRNGADAVRCAERACELTHYGKAINVGTLAAAYAEVGRFDDAISTAQKACALASESSEHALAQKNRELLVLYRTHQPYRDTAVLTPPAPSGRVSEPR